jgi:predicted enzyme related to lactoylglutathione lyase
MVNSPVGYHLSSHLNSHGRFLWYELATTDMEAAKSFYAEVVGWGTQDAPTPGISYTLFTAAGTPVSGLMGLPKDANESGFRPSWLGYVGVDDVDATAERLKQLGGAVHVPPKDIPNISRFSVAVDPQMATFALFKWLNAGHEQPADLDRPGHVGWHELLAADWEKAWSFYGKLFGWQKAGTDSGAMGIYQLFSTGGLTAGGMFTKPPTASVPFWLYYFNVGDIDAAVKRVKAGRGEIFAGPVEVPGDRWIVQCADPQGAIFALVGKRSHNGIGYFKRVTSRGSSDDGAAWRRRPVD